MNRDAESQQPDAQLGVRSFAGSSPWRTVVAQDAIGQAEATKDGDQMLLHRLFLLVFARE